MKISEDWLLIKKQVAQIKIETDGWDISPVLVTMLIAAEDHRFGRHHGVDLVSICRATWRTLFCGRIEGASTITMQLVRVLTGSYERTLKRKLVEMYLALRLTKYINQVDIPKFYLFVAYYGWRMNGLVQASYRLNIDLLTMTDLEAASIVARLKYPEPQKYDRIRLDKIRARAKYILSQTIVHTEEMQPHYLQKGDNNGTL
ncbi:TPA: biosynthetic peptidoglycan transglycosylase [Yersinia enterocolitica]|nr:transglycosylase domain-containing protein [Yersinia enterocolitica]HEN3310470.1 transglycosylase domain-containing protein [Yersinia enterocolitica]